MAKRFQGTTQLGVQNLGSGQASQLMNLGDKFAQFGRQKFAEAETAIIQEETQRGQAALVEGEAPQFQEERFIGGVRAKAFNKGLKHSYLASLSNDLRQDLATAEREHPDDVSGFDTKTSGLRAALNEQVDPVARNEVLQAFDSQTTRTRIKIQDTQAKRLRREQVSVANTELSTISNDAQINARSGDVKGSALDIQTYNARIDAAVDADLIDSSKAVSMKSDNSQTVQEQTFIGQIERLSDNEELGGFPAAFKSIDDLPPTPPNNDFTQQEWDTFKGQAVTALTKKQTLAIKAESEQSIELSREISDLNIQARTGTGNPEQIIKRTEELFNTGDITEQERTSIRTNLFNKDKAERKQAVDFSAVAARVAGNDAIVIDDKSVNAYYSQIITPSLEGMSDLESDVQKANFVDRTKRVPSELKAEVNTFLQSDNRDLIVRGSQLMDRFDNVPGLSEREFSTSERAFAEQVVNLSANMAPEEAVLLARQLTDPTNKARIEAKTLELSEDKKGFNNFDPREDVEDHFNPIFGGTKVGDIAGDQLAKEYDDQYEALFKAGMSKEAAKAKSLQLVSRNWSVSDVTGRVMKYAPDQYYQVNGSVDYIRPQLAREINIRGAFPEEIPEDRIFLQATEATARSAAGGKPAYRVIILDDDGTITPFFGGLWHPDQQEELDRVEAENKAAFEKRGKIPEPFSRKGSSSKPRPIKDDDLSDVEADAIIQLEKTGLSKETADKVKKTKGFNNKLHILRNSDLSQSELDDVNTIASRFGA